MVPPFCLQVILVSFATSLSMTKLPILVCTGKLENCFSLPHQKQEIKPMNRVEMEHAWMSEIKNGRSGLYGAEHLKCNHMVTLGFKGLMLKVNTADFE